MLLIANEIYNDLFLVDIKITKYVGPFLNINVNVFYSTFTTFFILVMFLRFLIHIYGLCDLTVAGYPFLLV